MGVDVELAEIRGFLALHEPFDSLGAAELDRLVRRLTMSYHRRGSVLLARGQVVRELVVLRSGAAEVRDADGILEDRGGAGAVFGAATVTTGEPSPVGVTAIEDCLVLLVPADAVVALGADHPEVQAFFEAQRGDRLGGAIASLQASTSGSPILRTRVSDLVGRDPVSVDVGATVHDAAVVMSEQRVSSLLVLDRDRLVGIVTDRDLRNRVLAVGRSVTAPVVEVMTADPVTGSADTLAFEVLLEMVSRGIHHLPIVDATERAVGVVTATDLLRLEQESPVYLAGDVGRQDTVDGVVRVARRLPRVAAALVQQDVSADEVGRVVTAVGDAVVRRLLELAEAALGAPPVPYCWVALGSRARLEQALAADQDTAIILEDTATADHDAYFAALAEQVTAALVRCGHPRCDGDVMATNPRLRRTVSRWRHEFSTWLAEPTPDAVLGASIYFDMRAVHGDARLHARLREHVLGAAPRSTRFLAHLAAQAVSNEPPLGFFRGFVVERRGDHRDSLDIKAGGINAVVELARVQALSIGSPAVNTRSRVRDATDAGSIGADRAHDLLDAFEFISYVRLRHQADQVLRGEPADSFVSPSHLSSVEKRHLREAFGIVRSAQAALAQRHPVQYIS